VSCGRIAAKFARIAGRVEVIHVRSGRTTAKQGLTCASIVRIVGKGPRSRNFARTAKKSDQIDAKFLATGERFDRTAGIYVATGAISGAIDVTRDTDTGKRGKGKRGRG
jgi:hypothetical protein